MYVIFWYIITKCTEFVVVIIIIVLFYLSMNMHTDIKQFSGANSNWLMFFLKFHGLYPSHLGHKFARVKVVPNIYIFVLCLFFLRL